MQGIVDLNRCFVVIRKDQEPDLELGRTWGRKIGGWVEWTEMLQQQRVVLLAEASSGKSAEFRNQVDNLLARGRPAFVVRIEELADQGFETALDPHAASTFETWRGSSADGWFFLDSVDEARLNRKSFARALTRFARDLGSSVERAHVFISCRVSDWNSREDRALIERLLPAWTIPKTPETTDSTAALLDPIFKEDRRTTTSSREPPTLKTDELVIVQLIPLSSDQCRTLAAAFGVRDVDSFMQGIDRYGLTAFSERPGDLLDLADYWNTHARFAPFAEMVEHSISRKLEERDRFRPDNEVLSSAQARHGAERLAAALTLGKSFTLRAPGHDPDPSLASGALEPSLVLSDWTPAQQNALLRRGAFAPSTYGRVRFHHRSTQEFLAAQWLDRILRSNCPRSEVWNLLFVNRYGVDTVVPSLRPAAAWLSLKHPDLREEIVRREPLVLLRHGDPSSLPIDCKSRLIATYAKKLASNELTDDFIEYRATWMFADPDLADDIREAWLAHPDVRFYLLRLIREGAIRECIDLARETALDEGISDVYRMVALEALVGCEDEVGLAAVAEHFVARNGSMSNRLVASFATTLYPSHLTTQQLLIVIQECQPPTEEDSTRGVWEELERLYEATPDYAARTELATRLTDLCLTPPFLESYRRISRRYAALAKGMGPIALRAAKALGDRKPDDYVVRLLMVTERVENDYYSHSESDQPSLKDVVLGNQSLVQGLFWANVEDARATAPDKEHVRFWHAYGPDAPLWELKEESLPWLYADLGNRLNTDDQRIALSAIHSILQKAGHTQEIERLAARLHGKPALQADLAAYLNPAPAEPETEAEKESRLRRQQLRAKRENERQQAQDSWVTFREYLQVNRSQLSDPRCLVNWKSGVFRLKHLTEWLRNRSQLEPSKAPCQWRLLEEGFSRQIAEAYRDGMKLVWRLTKPERPKRNGDNVTTKWTTFLSFGGLELEAAEDSNWMSSISDDEAKRAALHGCLSDQGYPKWIEPLLDSHRSVVLPIVTRRIKHEWRSDFLGSMTFLQHLSHQTSPAQDAYGTALIGSMVRCEPSAVAAFDRGLAILSRLDPSRRQSRRLVRVARSHLSRPITSASREFSLRWLAVLFLVSPDRAIEDLQSWLSQSAGSIPDTENTWAFLFRRQEGWLTRALSEATISTLERLLSLAYSHIRPSEDVRHIGAFARGARDDAEQAREAIVGALVSRAGDESYRALRSAATSPQFKSQASRFRELAHRRAELDAESPPWTADDVTRFELKHAAPVKTGSDLLRVVVAVLRDIQSRLRDGDVTSRPLLQRAETEEEVQNWLVEQLNFRSRGRFTAHRETEVADRNRPDVIVSSTTATVEVAIEVKHGGKRWTVHQLEKALRTQLARDYLRPEHRRHGVLLITQHHLRTWRETGSNRQIAFETLLEKLGSIAATVSANGSGPIKLEVVGIDAVAPNTGSSAPGDDDASSTAARTTVRNRMVRSGGG